MPDSTAVQIHTLSSTDAFIAFEYEDVPAVGVTRLARKVLQDGAQLLARSTTYSFASFGIERCGGSAGINAEGDDRDPAVAAFVEEVGPMVAEGRWATDPALGLSESDLTGLREHDPRPAELWADGAADRLTAEGALAAAAAVVDGLSGRRVAVVGKGPVADAARMAAGAAGAEVAGSDLGTECDVVLVAGKAGVVGHEDVADVRARVLVPLTPVAVTARAHAELGKADVVHVPDFLAVAAPLLRAFADGDVAADPAAAVGASVAELADRGTGLWMAAVERAEAFLEGWRGELPFGRPLA